MSSLHRLLEGLNQAALNAYEQSDPMNILFGQVESVAPLKIVVEQRLHLGEKQLILTDNVRDHEVEITVDHFTQNDAYLETNHGHPSVAEAGFDATHKHAYQGRKTFLVHNGLKKGENVILLRMQGGQKFVILDRLVN